MVIHDNLYVCKVISSLLQVKYIHMSDSKNADNLEELIVYQGLQFILEHIIITLYYKYVDIFFILQVT